MKLTEYATPAFGGIFAALCILSIGAAAAQTAAAPTASSPPTSVQAAINDLLAAGYEVKAVDLMSDAATKEVYPTQTNVPSQSFVTLQKGTSIAVCELNTFDWLSMTSSALADVTRCFKH
jgi:hypothetical protein